MTKKSIVIVISTLILGLAIFAFAVLYQNEQTGALNYSTEVNE